jgi:hypothetical protein
MADETAEAISDGKLMQYAMLLRTWKTNAFDAKDRTNKHNDQPLSGTTPVMDAKSYMCSTWEEGKEKINITFHSFHASGTYATGGQFRQWLFSSWATGGQLFRFE